MWVVKRAVHAKTEREKTCIRDGHYFKKKKNCTKTFLAYNIISGWEDEVWFPCVYVQLMLAHSKWPLITYSRRTACSSVSQEYLYFTFSFVLRFLCVWWMDICLIHTALPCQPHGPRHLRSICEGVNSVSVWSPLESGCSKCKNLDCDLKGWGDYLFCWLILLLWNSVFTFFPFCCRRKKIPLMIPRLWLQQLWILIAAFFSST